VRWVYAVSLLVGLGTLVVWVAWTLSAERGPDDRFGLTGRRVVAAVTAFGLGGLSSAFAGWGSVPAAGAALVAAGAAAFYAGVVGVD
jgi:hypothetical protein